MFDLLEFTVATAEVYSGKSDCLVLPITFVFYVTLAKKCQRLGQKAAKPPQSSGASSKLWADLDSDA